ncbi:MAG: L-serine ammonia-lyase, iron-sulfur-dependent, subunit alpha [Candidatus Woesearchaeota archaeon]
MESLRELYRIGYGPSSSHTMAPQRAAEIFLEKYPNAKKYIVSLYGSLASTGKGHLTDQVLKKTFRLKKKKLQIKWYPNKEMPLHPNAMLFQAFDKTLSGEWLVYSVGGGALSENGKSKKNLIYKYTTFNEIKKHYKKDLWKYVVDTEGNEIINYLQEVWQVMQNSIKEGLKKKSTLPGKLHLKRKAHEYYLKSKTNPKLKLYAYTLAVAEQNAAGSKIVTAPTCGSCGILPGLLLYLKEIKNFNDEEIIKALATAGIIGNLVKFNASISGAEVGCQGEIGTACAMAAGAATQLFKGTVNQIEYAAKMGLEHMLGMTCDPIYGLVQVPCIERNVMASSRALECAEYAIIDDTHIVSFDEIVKVMYETGKDLPSSYRETSKGGLAKIWLKNRQLNNKQ